MLRLGYFGVLLITFSFAVTRHVSAQDRSNTKEFKELIARYGKTDDVSFFYKDEWIADFPVDEGLAALPLADFLQKTLPARGLTYVLYQNRYVILLKDQQKSDSAETKTDVAAKQFKSDGKPCTLSGYVKDVNSGENIPGASVYAEELKEGAVTNAYGFYSLKMISGIYNLTISATGKSPFTTQVILDRNKSMDHELFEKVTQLKDVEVTAEAIDQNISSPSMSALRLSTKTMRTIPAFLGEVDVIKSIRLLPGVSSVGDGAGGFNVRGGNVDQNLILMDDAPIFNSSHLFGFFSTFNPDIVKEVTLHKGGMPPQYGGRISSVLDVKLSDGNTKQWKVSGGIGMISSRLAVEAPIIKDKTSVIIAGRYAYPDWIIHRIKNVNLKHSSGYFYDLNAKVRHRIDKKNDIQVSVYSSEDGFKLAADTSYNWNMLASSVKWNTIIKDKIFISTTGFLSRYDYGVSGTVPASAYTADLGIGNYGGKIDLSYSLNLNHRVDVGIQGSRYTFDPGKVTPGEGSKINASRLQEEYSNEYGVYIGDESKLNTKISVSGGVRFSFYQAVGPSQMLVYDPNQPRSPTTVVDTLSIGSGEKIKTYHGIEPRFSMKYSLDETSSVKIGYNRNIQYIHLISNTTAISPIDIWKSSNAYIKPQTAHQFSIGYFRNFTEHGIEASLEVYYKKIDNLVEYKDGASLFMNPYLESALLTATGRNYGAELLVRKTTGKLTGWVGYTYARSFRLVKRNAFGETINKEDWYPSNFDKPNDISVVANYKFTRRLSLSSNFTYSTGRPVTYPSSVYMVDGYAVAQYSERNQGRIPAYHRLDLGVTLEEGFRKQRRWKGSWTLSIVNAYGRRNAYSVFFKPDNGKSTQSYRLSVIGTIIPSLTYNFKF